MTTPTIISRSATRSQKAPVRPGDQRQTAAELAQEWASDPRWADVTRDYTAEDVIALRGAVREERTLARRGAENLWSSSTPTAGSPRSAR